MREKNNFDLLRLIAAAMVLVSHSYAIFGDPHAEPFTRFTKVGSMGSAAVYVFFIISGFLVTRSYVKGSGALNFLRSRILRIFPALWVCVLLCAFILGPIATTLPVGAYYVHPATYEYLKNMYLDITYMLPAVFYDNTYPISINGSIWTLPYEFGMYLAVLVLGIAGLLNRGVCTLITAVLALLYLFVHPTTIGLAGNNAIIYTEITSLGGLFAAGSMMSFMDLSFLRGKNIPLLACLVVVVFARSKFANAAMFVSLPIVVLGFGLMTSKAGKAVARMGDYSYGLYLYAFPVSQTVSWVTKHELNLYAQMALTFFATLILAALSWHLIERPALMLKRSAPVDGRAVASA
ncbi:acyltransferase family protein [Paraburkholderia bannensis]|uniref:acyltransferase family protein n=1 Tax=Paraburkholderia bannensis TaxID=765414 RepID=UPI002ABDCC4A|nr:acyltransferase [Paraburkholderia bannensis]